MTKKKSPFLKPAKRVTKHSFGSIASDLFEWLIVLLIGVAKVIMVIAIFLVIPAMLFGMNWLIAFISSIFKW
jgi:hypothetical protein